MKAVYENDNFQVVVVDNDGDRKYGAVNVETSVVEFKDSQIANAITYAEHANSFLKNRLWRLVAIQAEQSAAFLDKNGAAAALDDLSTELSNPNL